MDFQATPINILALLLAALALYVLYVLARNQNDSNVPLLFYGVLFAFVTLTPRQIDSYLFGGAFASALVLRFEFMNTAFTRIVSVLEMLGVAAILAKLVGEVFG